MTYLSSVSSSVQSFIVENPLPGDVKYQIVARREGCNPELKSATSYGETRSNINELIVSTNEIENRSSAFQIIPNPANVKIFLNYTEPGNNSLQIKIYDLTGKLWGSFSLTNNQTGIDISRFPPGIYFLHLEDTKGPIVRKFVIQR
jgi:hypothetical protein